MKTQMTLIYAKQTGHGLAVVTRAASAQGPAQPGELTEEKQKEIEQQELADLVGAALTVRHVVEGAAADVEFAVSADGLGVFTGDADDSVLKNPRAFYFDAEEKQLKPLPASAVSSAVLSGNDVTVTLPGPATEDTRVWVLIEAQGAGLPKSQVTSGTILTTDLNKTTKTMTIRALSPDTYSILTLVTGLLPTAFDDTV